jgi:hypothetical protein
MASGLMLSVECDRRALQAESPAERVLGWTVALPDHGGARAPLNLMIVCCVTEALRPAVEQAVAQVCANLTVHDQVEVQTTAPDACDDMLARWFAAGTRFAAAVSPSRVCRVVVITDGVGQREVTDYTALVLRARQLHYVGVGTLVFGLGARYDEQLLATMAEQGGGAFAAVPTVDELAPALRREVGLLAHTVVKGAVLTVTAPPQVSIHVLGDLPYALMEHGISLALGDLGSGEQYRIFTRVVSPTGAAGARVPIRGEVRTQPLAGGCEVATAEQVLRYTQAPVGRRDSQRICQSAGGVEMAAAVLTALALERMGRRGQAELLLRERLTRVAPFLERADCARYEALQQMMHDGLSEEHRRQEYLAAYAARRGRLVSS